VEFAKALLYVKEEIKIKLLNNYFNACIFAHALAFF
jgi:hypothetical protein